MTGARALAREREQRRRAVEQTLRELDFIEPGAGDLAIKYSWIPTEEIRRALLRHGLEITSKLAVSVPAYGVPTLDALSDLYATISQRSEPRPSIADMIATLEAAAKEKAK